MPWMTAGECADWWCRLLNDNADKAEKIREQEGRGADTVSGFILMVGHRSVIDGTNMLLLDNLRLGEGTGSASAGGSRWGYVADIGRFASFIPLFRAPRALTVAAKTTAVESSAAKAGAAKLGSSASGEGLAWFDKARDNFIKVDFWDASLTAKHELCWADCIGIASKRSGHIWMTIEHIADVALPTIRRGKAMIDDLNKLEYYSAKELEPILKELHIPCRPIALGVPARTFEETLETIVPMNERGTMIIGVQYEGEVVIRNLKPKAAGHALCVTRDIRGNIQVLDRTGATVRALKELENLGIKNVGYKGIGKGTMLKTDSAIWVPESRMIHSGPPAAVTSAAAQKLAQATAPAATSSGKSINWFIGGAIVLPVTLKAAACFVPQKNSHKAH